MRPGRMPSRTSTTAKVVLSGALAWLIVLCVVDPMSATVHGDGYYTWLWARSIVFDQDLDFANDYEICNDPWNLAHTAQGDAINQWNPGPSLFWIPILLFDLATDHPALHDSNPLVANGCDGALAERAVRGSLVAGALTIFFGFWASRRSFGEGPALFGAVAVGLFSPLTYYATMLLSYGHAASACMSGLVVFLWDRERRRPTSRGFLWLGVATGLAMLTRPQNAVLAVLPLCLWLERAVIPLRERNWRKLGLHIARGISYVLGAAALFSPQIAQWYTSYGEIFFLPQGPHYLRLDAPRLVNIYFAPANGLLPWNPILYLSLIGLVILAARRKTRGLGIPLLLLLALHSYVIACVSDWWGAIGFPGRRFDAMSVPFMLGLAAFVERAMDLQRRRATFLPMAFASALFLVLGTWSTASQVAVANATRIDIAHRSDSMWLDTWGRAAHPLWEHVGNPLAWPASIPFALRYRIHPRAWDFASAPELFFHHWLTLERVPHETTFDFVHRHSELAVGFDPPIETRHGMTARGIRNEYARAIVPISWPEIGALRFSIGRRSGSSSRPAHLWLELDGEDLGTHRIDPEQSTLTVLVYERHEGICELRMRLVGGWVGFRTMELLDPRPSPFEREAPRLRERAERRRAWRASRRGPSTAGTSP